MCLHHARLFSKPKLLNGLITGGRVTLCAHAVTFSADLWCELTSQGFLPFHHISLFFHLTMPATRRTSQRDALAAVHPLPPLNRVSLMQRLLLSSSGLRLPSNVVQQPLLLGRLAPLRHDVAVVVAGLVGWQPLPARQTRLGLTLSLSTTQTTCSRGFALRYSVHWA